MQVEGGAYGPELEAGHFGLRRVATQQIHQQRGDQRAVNDQARVALDLGGVLAVVVDAVGVEGQRRVTKQQHVIWNDLSWPGRTGRRGDGRWFDIARLLRCAVDDVVKFNQRWCCRAVAAQVMPHFHKHQLAGTTFFLRDIDNRAGAGHRIPHTQRRAELELAGRPHAPRQPHGGQETTAPGVAVGAHLAVPVHRQEVQPVPQRRQRCASGHGCGRLVQCGRQGGNGRGPHRVVHGFAAAYPGGQVGVVFGHGGLQRCSANERGQRKQIVRVCRSPSAVSLTLLNRPLHFTPSQPHKPRKPH